jgi:hypothetical protein
MSAMAWAHVRRVVIALSAREVAAAAWSFYTPELLLGGVLADRTNRLFREARQLREALPDTTSGDHAA